MLPGTRPVRMTGFPRPCLSQSSECTSRPGPSAEGLMPKAARERVASPRAGTALARAAWNASQAASDWARDGPYVTNTGTNVNVSVTRNFVDLRCERGKCEFVGWAERSEAHVLIDDRDGDRGHGALRLCPPYACLRCEFSRREGARFRRWRSSAPRATVRE
jgi:hypothetical protein